MRVLRKDWRAVARHTMHSHTATTRHHAYLANVSDGSLDPRGVRDVVTCRRQQQIGDFDVVERQGEELVGVVLVLLAFKVLEEKVCMRPVEEDS